MNFNAIRKFKTKAGDEAEEQVMVMMAVVGRDPRAGEFANVREVLLMVFAREGGKLDAAPIDQFYMRDLMKREADE